MLTGIPINGSLLPTLSGYELSTGVELDYDEDVDFYCPGSSTSKSVCQLYGNAKVLASHVPAAEHITSSSERVVEG